MSKKKKSSSKSKTKPSKTKYIDEKKKMEPIVDDNPNKDKPYYDPITNSKISISRPSHFREINETEYFDIIHRNNKGSLYSSASNNQRRSHWGWIDQEYKTSTRFGYPPRVKMNTQKFPQLNNTNTVAPKATIDSDVSAGDIDGEEIKVEDNNPEVGVTPLDGNDPYIYSFKVGAAPYSFMEESFGFDKKMPPPLYILHKELAKQKPTKQKDILYGLDFNDDGYLH